MTEDAKAKNTAYKNRWISENKERINLVVPKGRKQAIQTHATAQGESLNGYVVKAIDERIERDKGTDI